MLFMTAVTTCAFMLPCAPTQVLFCPPRNTAPPRMNELGDLIGRAVSGGSGKLTAAVVALVIFSSATTVVQPGEVGIVTTLGQLSPAPFQAGFHFKSPLADVRTFSVKTILTEESTTVPTKEGLSIELDTALLYRLEPEKVQNLILSVGSGFERVVIQPEVRSIIRGLTSEVEAKALYTSGRGELQRRLKEDLSEAFGRSMVLKIPKEVRIEISRRPAGGPDQSHSASARAGCFVRDAHTMHRLAESTKCRNCPRHHTAHAYYY